MWIAGKAKAGKRDVKADLVFASDRRGRKQPDKQLIDYYVDGTRIGIGFRVVPAPGEAVTVCTFNHTPLGLFRVLSVEPSVHPSTGRPPRVARCRLAPLPSGGQGERAPSTGDPA